MSARGHVHRLRIDLGLWRVWIGRERRANQWHSAWMPNVTEEAAAMVEEIRNGAYHHRAKESSTLHD